MEEESKSTKNKRVLSDSSFEEDTAKKQCINMSSDQTPAWAILLQTEIRETRAELQKLNQNFCIRMSNVEQKVDNFNVTMTGLQSKVRDVEETANNNKSVVAQLEAENGSMRGEITHLTLMLDEQIDRDLRASLKFTGLKRENEEKTWADTEAVLVDWLANHTNREPTFITII